MSSRLLEMKKVDREAYAARLMDFLPPSLIDIHTHVWLERFRAPAGDEPVRAVTWPALVARDCPVEDLLETYRLLFPGKSVTPLLFGNLLSHRDDMDGGNQYVSEAAAQHHLPALIFSSPRWSAEELEQRTAAGGFVGAKSYLSLAETYLPEKELRIYDFFPRSHLEVLNRRGWIAMLHIPRDGRLRDPVNLAQLLELEERYPKLRLIVAHVGRAYCPEDVGQAFELLRQTSRLSFDLSANTNEFVFRRLIDAVGPKRILFGSDLPITRMRMRRVCENGNYVNVVPRGLYGDVTGDRHTREVDGEEAERLTFFLYEEIDAFRRAAVDAGLTREDIADVFHGNAARMLEEAARRPTLQLEMIWPPDRQPTPIPLPPGYRLRTWQPGDEAGYLRVMHGGGFTYWTPSNVAEALRAALPDGLFFAVEEATGQIVATAVAQHYPIDRHPYGGQLGWVACDPDHRGRGLGAAVCAAAVRRLLAAGYSRIYLKTDDFRLPAIKTYLRQGWQPLLFAPGMAERWQTVAQTLHLDWTAIRTVTPA